MYRRDQGDLKVKAGSVTLHSVCGGDHGDEDKGRLSDSVNQCIREI